MFARYEAFSKQSILKPLTIEQYIPQNNYSVHEHINDTHAYVSDLIDEHHNHTAEIIDHFHHGNDDRRRQLRSFDDAMWALPSEDEEENDAASTGRTLSTFDDLGNIVDAVHNHTDAVHEHLYDHFSGSSSTSDTAGLEAFANIIANALQNSGKRRMHRRALA